MIMNLLETLGPWIWVVIGLALLGLEIILPSTFLLWPGLSALVVGIITLIIGLDSPLWPWQAQLLVFLVLTLLLAYLGRGMMKKKNWDESENPQLNERGAQLVGNSAVLTSAITNGFGRAKIGDTTWRVKGPDAKAGSMVRVVRYEAGTLEVELV